MSLQAKSRVFRGAMVVDGSGAPGRRVEVLCSGGMITAVGANLVGEEVVDCGGLTLAPGFIDTHSHSDLKLFEDPLLPMKTRQGVTLEILGQDGISVAPVRAEGVREARRQLAGLDGDPPQASWAWRSVGDYLQAIRGARTAENFAYLVPHGALRTFVMGSEARPPTPDELDRMVRELDLALSQGAIGLSTGLIYPPCCYAEREELVALARVAGKHRGPVVVHLRSESDYILEAVDEMVDVCRQGSCALHISHWKIAGRENFGRAQAMIDRVEDAQRSGLTVTCDQYPYDAGSTMLGAILPPWVHDGGPEAAVTRLSDRHARARMRVEMTSPPPQHWDNFWRWTGPEGIVVSDIPSGRRKPLVGQTLKQIAGAGDALDVALDLLRDEALGVGMVTHSQNEPVVEQLMKRPYVNVCTDGLLGGRPHPRAYGTYPRVLGRYVREKRVVSLEEAVRKMTSQAARAMNLTGLGKSLPGISADLVLFDPAVVSDRATYQEPMQLPVGIEQVWVGGAKVEERNGGVVTRGA